MTQFSVFRISSPPGSNVYFVNTSPAVIIDAGHPEFANETLSILQQEVPFDQTAYILCTHSHPDHIGAATVLQKATGASLRIFTPAANDKLTPEHKKEIRLEIALPQFDKFLCDGDRIELDDDIIEVIHTPGHADDHCSFYFTKRRYLFTGDLITHEDIGFLNLNKPYRQSLDELRTSICRCAALDAHRVFPGHGEPYRIAPWKKHLRKLSLFEHNPQLLIPHTLISPFLFLLWSQENVTRSAAETYITDHAYLFDGFLENATPEVILQEFKKFVSLLEITGTITSCGDRLLHRSSKNHQHFRYK